MTADLVSAFPDTRQMFNRILRAMSRPGTLQETTPPTPATGKHLDPAAAVILFTLLDADTPLWVGSEELALATRPIRQHTGAPLTRLPANALFALETRNLSSADPGRFNPGTAQVPHRSTTLLVPVEDIREDGPLQISGPGIQAPKRLGCPGLPDTFFRQRATLSARFPMGIDMILVCGSRFTALPRTTVVEEIP
jgi:alpha-D-ribose 1-methylphosphonate 5-triphosphate synthase subunit PhnH